MGGAVRAEIRKIFTTRLWWGMLFGVVLIGGGVSALFASLVGTTQAGADPADNPFLKMSVGTAQLIYSAGFFWPRHQHQHARYGRLLSGQPVKAEWHEATVARC